MKVLLIRPPRPNMHYVSFGEQTFPIGMGFLISSLREKNHQVYFIDNYLEPEKPFDEHFLISEQIDFLGMYCCSITVSQAIRIMEKVQILREKNKWSGKIIVGGPHPSLSPETLPDFVDYIVRGEGEKAIVDIVEGYCKERIVQYPRLKNLDELPFPAYDVLLKMPYNTRFAMMDQYKMANMNTSRGCPFGCTFCSVDQFWGKQYTYFSAERVVSDIEKLKNEFGNDAVYFREDNFLVNKERTLKICSLLKEKNIKIVWGCEARVDSLQNEDFVKAISQAGCRHVFLGVESLNQRVLYLMKKNITIAQIERAADLCKKYDIMTFASFIIGLPGETEEEINHTMTRAYELFDEKMVAFNPFVGYPYSEMYYQAVQDDLVGFKDKNDFLYLKSHDHLIQLAFKNMVSDYRKNPLSFINLNNNINNFKVTNDINALLDGNVLEIGLTKSSCIKSTHYIKFEGLLSLYRETKAIKKVKTIFLNNILHRVHQDDLTFLIDLLRSIKSENGKIVCLTFIRKVDDDLKDSLMRNYYSEYLFSEQEIKEKINPFQIITYPSDLNRLFVFETH